MDKTLDMVTNILITGIIMDMMMQMMVKMVPQMQAVQNTTAPLETPMNIQTMGTLAQTFISEA